MQRLRCAIGLRRMTPTRSQSSIELIRNPPGHPIVNRPKGADNLLVACDLEGRRNMDSFVYQPWNHPAGVTSREERQYSPFQTQAAYCGDAERGRKMVI
jgi:hypothetical protein